MTEQEHTELRLKILEDQAVGARQVERDVDRLKIELPRMENSLTEFRTESLARHDQLHASLTRLHQRLDQLAAEEYREQGARAERTKLGRMGLALIGAGTAFGGVIVGVVSLLVQNQ